MGEDKEKKHLVLEKEVWDEIMRLKLDWDMDSGSDVVRRLIYENADIPVGSNKKILEKLEEIKEELKSLKN